MDEFVALYDEDTLEILVSMTEELTLSDNVLFGILVITTEAFGALYDEEILGLEVVIAEDEFKAL